MFEKKKSKKNETPSEPDALSDVEIGMGMEVKDVITGVTGIVTARSEFFNGCVRYFVEPQIKKDATEPPKALWFDVQLLVVTKEDTPARKLYLSQQVETLHIGSLDVKVDPIPGVSRPGGPRPDPQLREDHPDRRGSA